MCQLGRSGMKVHVIPKEKAVKAFKIMTTYGGSLQPLVFNSTSFERLKDGQHHSYTMEYHHGGTFRTEPPDVFAGDQNGNYRGFWAWAKREHLAKRTEKGYRVAYEVRMWGRVVKHRFGYRAEYIKIVRRVK